MPPKKKRDEILVTCADEGPHGFHQLTCKRIFNNVWVGTTNDTNYFVCESSGVHILYTYKGVIAAKPVGNDLVFHTKLQSGNDESVYTWTTWECQRCPSSGHTATCWGPDQNRQIYGWKNGKGNRVSRIVPQSNGYIFCPADPPIVADTWGHCTVKEDDTGFGKTLVVGVQHGYTSFQEHTKLYPECGNWAPSPQSTRTYEKADKAGFLRRRRRLLSPLLIRLSRQTTDHGRRHAKRPTAQPL